MAILRLNYAIELRYGVLRDIADRVREGRPVDLAMGWVNVIWQRDANAIALRRARRLRLAAAGAQRDRRPAVSVRWLAEQFGKRWGSEPRFEGSEAPTALLSNASRMEALFGPPDVGIEEMIERVAEWVEQGGAIAATSRRTSSRGREGSEHAASLRRAFRAGMVIPAHPLALTAARKLDERRQRALTRYYLDAGAGGVAVGRAHHAVRHPGSEGRPATARCSSWRRRRSPSGSAAGGSRCCGWPAWWAHTRQAVREARIARDLGYHVGLLSLGALAARDGCRAASRTAARWRR